MDFTNQKERRVFAKVFKAGNSEGIRLTKNDIAKFKVKAGDQVLKEISPDGMSITYKRLPKVSSKTKKDVSQILKEDSELIKKLKDL